MLRAARNIFDSNSTPSFVLDLPRAKDSSHHQDYYISKLGKTYALCRKTLLFATVSGWGVDPILVLWCTGLAPTPPINHGWFILGNCYMFHSLLFSHKSQHQRFGIFSTFTYWNDMCFVGNFHIYFEYVWVKVNKFHEYLPMAFHDVSPTWNNLKSWHATEKFWFWKKTTGTTTETIETSREGWLTPPIRACSIGPRMMWSTSDGVAATSHRRCLSTLWWKWSEVYIHEAKL